jgi:hypothetical protein
MLIVVLRLRPGFRQLRTLYPLCLSLTPVMPFGCCRCCPPGGAACLVYYCLTQVFCVRSPSRPAGSRVVPCGCCCRWSRCVRLSTPPCAPLSVPVCPPSVDPFPLVLFDLFTSHIHTYTVCPPSVDPFPLVLFHLLVRSGRFSILDVLVTVVTGHRSLTQLFLHSRNSLFPSPPRPGEGSPFCGSSRQPQAIPDEKCHLGYRR